jgi:hypothetical protein
MKNKIEKKDFRESISKYLVFTIVGTTLIIGFVVLKKSYGSTEFDLSFIGQTLLPLWATWVGTILAFYFGKSNFEAATKSYQDIIKSLTPEEKMASIKVQNVMIPFNQIEHIQYKEPYKEKIEDILKNPKFKEYNRFAFIDESKILKYMIHKVQFTNYVASKAFEKELAKDDVINLTFDKFIAENKDNNYVLNTSTFISLTSNLLDAKQKMDSIKECQDVFITQTGKDTEPILGLITNNIILDNAKV